MSRSPRTSKALFLPKGFRFAGIAAGIKPTGALDLALAEVPGGATAAALFTSNRVIAAPLVVGKELLRAGGRIRGVLVNSGNANCATGPGGLRACHEVCRKAAGWLGGSPQEIFPSSTGVIGVPLPKEKIVGALPTLFASREASLDGARRFAQAIMTTDTRPKLASLRFRCGGASVTLLGMAKGAGMIHPSLATMLVYLFADVAATAPQLQRVLRMACARTFNFMSVDGDTSTNDTVLLLASGAAAARLAPAQEKDFGVALEAVCASLAAQIVSDGEGVQHVVTLCVEGARTQREAEQVARAIVTSALVKTSWAGADPNWGRVLAAAGRSGAAIDPARVSIFFGRMPVCRKGVACDFDEPAAVRYLSGREFEVRVDLGQGRARCTYLTC
ncbi:MAG TPA: bifunctional glutamate N-acetyltransferase/amino-acid acetyltransferase ArgJ, partial [Terriglobales bacterium]|nr:bifunctional glutamate N-acetyltransferase/amino-acid acetyltransferase ArgJ [Terriglobales bacterium]